MSREAQEKATTYGSGGWRSRKRLEVRPDVRREVQLVARGGEGTEGPAPNGVALLLERFVYSKGGSFKVNPGRDGKLWFKASWDPGGGRVYVLVQGERPGNMYAPVVDLAEQVLEVEWGLRRPSPDRWGG